MTKQISYFLQLIVCCSCNHVTNSLHNSAPGNTVQIATAQSAPAHGMPIPGYRYQIIGDFDGDSITDTLREHFYSIRDQKETNKYYSGIDDVWALYDSAYARDCQSFFLSNNPKLDTVPIGGILGPIWVKNEGNIDRDNGDEISYVESSPQQSSISHCNILSFKNDQWTVIYRFSVREWQFPPLPQAGKTYGLFGMNGSYAVGDDKAINQYLENQADNFPGLISKLPSGKVKIQTFTDEAIDTTLVLDLSKHPEVYN